MRSLESRFVRSLRLGRGMSEVQMASKMGVPVSAYLEFEDSPRLATLRFRLLFLNAVGVSSAELTVFTNLIQPELPELGSALEGHDLRGRAKKKKTGVKNELA